MKTSIHLILLLCGLGVALPALAHKLRVFAAAEGANISGYVYFAGGARARGTTVTLFGPDGARFGEIVTDPSGAFSFPIKQRIDYRVFANAGGGHQAEFMVRADEFPATLPAGPATLPAPADSPPPSTAPPVTPTTASAPVLDAQAIQAAVEQAVARQLRPLREQLDAYEEKVRWHDVLGGIGYIMGLAGIGFYLLARRHSPPMS